MPVDEDKLRIDAARAARAQALIENELLSAAFADLEKAYTDRWRATHLDDDAGRERLFIAVNVVGKVKDHLMRVISDGKLAAFELNSIAKEAERKKKFGIL